MVYFKVLKDNEYLGVAAEEDLRQYQKKHNIILTSDIQNAQFVQLGDILYHDAWLQKVPEGVSCEEATILSIGKEEYDILRESELSLPVMAPAEETQEEIPVETDITLEFVKKAKLSDMDFACQRAIMDGVDIALSNGEVYHFGMDFGDQFNMASALTRILSGATEILYHADGEDYKYYSADDILTIAAAMNAHKDYYALYYSCLKNWINSLTKTGDIHKIAFGDDIPEQFQSELFKQAAGI